jgi:hypothetical protein
VSGCDFGQLLFRICVSAEIEHGAADFVANFVGQRGIARLANECAQLGDAAAGLSVAQQHTADQ